MKFNVIKCKGIHMGRSIHNCTCIVMDSKCAATQKMKFWSFCVLFSWDISPVLSFGCKDKSAYLALLEKNETEFNHVTPQLRILYAFLIMFSQEEYYRTRFIYLLDDLHHSFVLDIINVQLLGKPLLPLCRKKLSPPPLSLLEERKPPHLAS